MIKQPLGALKWSTGVIKWFTGLPWLDKTAIGGAKMVYGRDKMVYVDQNGQRRQ